MNCKVFCVDCNGFYELEVFSREHKKHEMKIMSEVLEDRKKEYFQLLENRKEMNNVHMTSFKEGENIFEDIKVQATKLKTHLNSHSNSLKEQVESNRIAGCQTIDTQLSKIENAYNNIKNSFIHSENGKLLTIKKTIDNLNENTVNNFSLRLPVIPKSAPTFKEDLELAFIPATFIKNKYFPSIVSSNYEDEFIYNLEFDKRPYFISQDKVYLYAYYINPKQIRVYYKFTNKRKTILEFEDNFRAYNIVCIKDKFYVIDFNKSKRGNMVICDENGVYQKLVLKTPPIHLSVDNSNTLLITIEKNVSMYDASTEAMNAIPGTSNVGRVLRCWPVDSNNYVLLLDNRGENELVKMQYGKTINRCYIKLDFLAKDFNIHVNVDGLVCLLEKKEQTVTILDNNFHEIRRFCAPCKGKMIIKDIFMDDRKKIYLIILHSDNSCEIRRVIY